MQNKLQQIFPIRRTIEQLWEASGMEESDRVIVVEDHAHMRNKFSTISLKIKYSANGAEQKEILPDVVPNLFQIEPVIREVFGHNRLRS